jgi:hypothetical protein
MDLAGRSPPQNTACLGLASHRGVPQAGSSLAPEACRIADTVVLIQSSLPWSQPTRLHGPRGALLCKCVGGVGGTSPRESE